MTFRFHQVALPHTPVHPEFSADAYQQKVRGFAKMMTSLGHEIITYASEGSDVEGELVEILSRDDQREIYGDYDYRKEFFQIEWDKTSPHWTIPNERIIKAIKERVQPKDFICLIGGNCQQPIAEAFPNHLVVEHGVGYSGIFSKFRVFESYAWMHHIYGRAGIKDGHFYDAVIPPFLDPNEFTVREGPGEYHLYLGRLIDRKGWRIAVEATERAGEKLYMAGQVGDGLPDLPDHVVHVGYVDPAGRRELFAGAKALWMPTQYIEPGGNVHVEAMASGVPVIATDWGIATETVEPFQNGFRCRTLAEFTEAASLVEHLDPGQIHKMSERYWHESVAVLYERYFSQLDGLWREGWYEDTDDVDLGRYL